MKDQITISKNFKLLTFVLIGIGVVSFALGFVFDAKRTWANYLLNNYYFLSIAIGAAFFGAIQYITNSGWSAAFKRIPEAMVAYIPFAAVFFVILFFEREGKCGARHIHQRKNCVVKQDAADIRLDDSQTRCQ